MAEARRLTGQKGRNYTAVQGEVAQVLATTYKLEVHRHRTRIQTGSSDATVPVKRFTEHFGTTAKSRRGYGPGVDNIEQRPKSIDSTQRAGIWLKLAQRVIESRINPETFIRRQFQLLPIAADVPSPEFMLSESAARNYANAVSAMHQELSMALRLNNRCFRSRVAYLAVSPLGLTSEQVWARVLEDTDAELSAMFRYCMAVSIAKTETVQDAGRFEEIAEMFKTQAALQFVFAADVYVTTWKDFVPAGFPAEADRIYCNHLGLGEEFHNG